PARRLDHAALDLVGHAVGIHDLAHVDAGHRALHAHLAGLAVDGDFGGDRAVAGEILVAGVCEAPAAVGAAFAARHPAGALCGWLQTSCDQPATLPSGSSVPASFITIAEP